MKSRREFWNFMNSGKAVLNKEIMQKEVVGCYVSNSYEVVVENFR